MDMHETTQKSNPANAKIEPISVTLLLSADGDDQDDQEEDEEEEDDDDNNDDEEDDIDEEVGMSMEDDECGS